MSFTNNRRALSLVASGITLFFALACSGETKTEEPAAEEKGEKAGKGEKAAEPAPAEPAPAEGGHEEGGEEGKAGKGGKGKAGKGE